MMMHLIEVVGISGNSFQGPVVPTNNSAHVGVLWFGYIHGNRFAHPMLEMGPFMNSRSSTVA